MTDLCWQKLQLKHCRIPKRLPSDLLVLVKRVYAWSLCEETERTSAGDGVCAGESIFSTADIRTVGGFQKKSTMPWWINWKGKLWSRRRYGEENNGIITIYYEKRRKECCQLDR
jgi:hypothetical protein